MKSWFSLGDIVGLEVVDDDEEEDQDEKFKELLKKERRLKGR